MKLTKLLLMTVSMLLLSQAANAALGEIPKDEVKPGTIFCAEMQKKLDQQAANIANEQGRAGNANSAQ